MTVFTDKCKIYVPRLMKDLQITRIQACGILGNIGAETGGFRYMQELKPTVKGSKGGYGWMQWTGPRRRKFEDWAKTNNLNPALDETNYRYLVLETTTDEKHSLEQLRKTETIAAATHTFMAQNLRPGVPHLEARTKYAHQAQEATEIIEAKKEETQDKTATTVGTAVVAGGFLYFFQEHWVAILAAAAAIGTLGWMLVHRAHKHEQEELLVNQAKAQTKGKK